MHTLNRELKKKKAAQKNVLLFALFSTEFQIIIACTLYWSINNIVWFSTTNAARMFAFSTQEDTGNLFTLNYPYYILLASNKYQLQNKYIKIE